MPAAHRGIASSSRVAMHRIALARDFAQKLQPMVARGRRYVRAGTPMA
jgi:hypothetical protein